jgi:hypothetical protein
VEIPRKLAIEPFGNELFLFHGEYAFMAGAEKIGAFFIFFLHNEFHKKTTFHLRFTLCEQSLRRKNSFHIRNSCCSSQKNLKIKEKSKVPFIP